jgi:hypothetical protein
MILAIRAEFDEGGKESVPYGIVASGDREIDCWGGDFWLGRGVFFLFSYPFVFERKKEGSFEFVADRERLVAMNGRGCKGDSSLAAAEGVLGRVAGTHVWEESFGAGRDRWSSTWLRAD